MYSASYTSNDNFHAVREVKGLDEVRFSDALGTQQFQYQTKEPTRAEYVFERYAMEKG